MKRDKLRAIVGLGMVSGHFCLLLAVAILTALDKYLVDEMFVLLGIISPLFATYSTVVIKAFTSTGEYSTSKKVPLATAAVSIGVPGFFLFVILCGIFWKAFGPLGFEGLVKLVGVAETLLGAYVGIVVQSFFGPLPQAAANGGEG